MNDTLPIPSTSPGVTSGKDVAASRGTAAAASREIAAEAHSKPRLVARLGRAITYDVALVPVGLAAMAGSTLGRSEVVHERWRRLARFLGSAEPLRLRRPRRGSAVLQGFSSLVLGLVCWFLVMMLVFAVVRGPFYGFVEQGPYGPGTWGGPTKAGAWAVHAAIALPLIPLIASVLRIIALLHAATVRHLYGSATPWWTVPAGAVLTVAGVALLYSWTQQL